MGAILVAIWVTMIVCAGIALHGKTIPVNFFASFIKAALIVGVYWLGKTGI